MKFTELLYLVWINMIQNKFKVLLTSLGIIVGAITIVLVIAIGQGGEQQAASQFSGLSADTIYINPNYQNLGMSSDISKIEKLTEENIQQIMDENTNLSGIYLRNSTYKETNINGKKEYSSIAGVTQDYADISSLNFSQGEDFTDEEMENGDKVAVIGSGIVEKYFSNEQDALGKFIKIDKNRFKIIGVLERNADGLQGMSPDDTIYIPLSAMKESGLITEYDIPQVVAKVSDLNSVKSAMAQIENTLNYYLENSSDYLVEDAGSRIDAATKSARTMKMLLISVAAIVFVVGGIGIMNVLFVTIKERTKEIGVLKALGNTKKDIMMQFLLESVSIGVFGGGIGILLSVVAMYFIGFSDIAVVSSVEGKIIAFAFAVLTSTVFGFYPAYKASLLKPVDALNYE